MMMLGEKPPPGSSMNSSSSGGSSNSAWVSSYEIQSEGILPSGWIEKHARALPSAIIVVTTLVLPPLGNDNDRQGHHQQQQQKQQQSIGHAVRTLENLRATLAEKRNTPFHLVCLLKEDSSGGVVVSKGQQHKIDSIREKICQELNI